MNNFKKRSRKALPVLSIVSIVGGLVAGAYFGVWRLFAKPLLVFFRSISAGSVTWRLFFETAIKCILAYPVSAVIINVCLAFGKALLQTADEIDAEEKDLVEGSDVRKGDRE